MIRWFKILFTLVVAAAMLFSFYTGISMSVEHTEQMQNAVPVVATVEGSVQQFREKEEFVAGAGDIVDTYTSVESYHTCVVSYTYQGVEYQCGSSDYLGETGSKVDLLIDPAKPDRILEGESGATAYYVYGGMFAAIFLVIAIVWYRNKQRSGT